MSIGRAVQEQFHKLLFALEKEFDGRVEGIRELRQEPYYSEQVIPFLKRNV